MFFFLKCYVQIWKCFVEWLFENYVRYWSAFSVLCTCYTCNLSSVLYVFALAMFKWGYKYLKYKCCYLHSNHLIIQLRIANFSWSCLLNMFLFEKEKTTLKFVISKTDQRQKRKYRLSHMPSEFIIFKKWTYPNRKTNLIHVGARYQTKRPIYYKVYLKLPKCVYRGGRTMHKWHAPPYVRLRSRRIPRL